LLGTDTDNAYLVPGHSAHEELGLLTAAGLTPFEAIAAGTRDAAMALGLTEQIGTIAAGKRADLVLVEGDPFADVGQLRRIAGVMANGRWLPRSDLDMLLGELVARNG
jgi:imidazolonepropionase-like amidohydrolase